MADITLTAETGRPIGSRPSNRLRADGKVPAVVYGQGSDPTPIAVEWRALRQALTTDAGLNALITLQIDGASHLTIVKEMQRDRVRRSVSHVDFIIINPDEAIVVDVPIVFEGDAEQVTREDGMVDHVLFSLTVLAKPDSIPNELRVDVSNMTIGDSIRVGDLNLPAGVTTEVDAEEPVATAQITRATIEVAEEEEFAEALDELAEAEAADNGGSGGGEGGDSES
ncbi:50S ribosomal protein L25 [soil metagenome]